MKTRKGPYGYFATEEISEEMIYNYAEEVINTGILKEFLPVYINSIKGITEVAFDCSGKVSIQNYDSKAHPNLKDLIKRRIAIRDFFLSLLRTPSLLLFPSRVNLSPEYIYTNRTNTSIHVCYLPTYADVSSLAINSINTVKLEETLNSNFFSEVLSNDERQQITFLITNNEHIKLTKFIKELDIKKIPQKKRKKKKNSQFPYKLIVSLTTSLVSLGLVLNNQFSMSILLFAISGIVLISAINDDDEQEEKLSITKVKSTNNNRKSILFTKDEQTENINSTPLFLISEDTNNPIQYGMYTSKTIIGSDQFLTDLCITSENIDYIQAEISNVQQLYYVETLGKYPTYLEHRKLQQNQKYEIKNGQTLTLGDINLRIGIGFDSI